MVAEDQRRLYDQRTHETLRRRRAKAFVVTVGICAVVVAGLSLVGHMEFPMLAEFAGYCADAWRCDGYPGYLDWLAGGAGFLLFGCYGMVLARFQRGRPPAPTVFCEGCDGAGWVADLEQSNGLCPRCRQDRFTYVSTPQPIGMALNTIVEPGMAGRDLLERRRAHPWDPWLYQRYL